MSLSGLIKFWFKFHASSCLYFLYFGTSMYHCDIWPIKSSYSYSCFQLPDLSQLPTSGQFCKVLASYGICVSSDNGIVLRCYSKSIFMLIETLINLRTLSQHLDVLPPLSPHVTIVDLYAVTNVYCHLPWRVLWGKTIHIIPRIITNLTDGKVSKLQ